MESTGTSDDAATEATDTTPTFNEAKDKFGNALTETTFTDGESLFTALAALICISATAQKPYIPSEDNLKARQEFADSKLGIFLHWGIYSMFAQGEWYLSKGKLSHQEYKKAADAFYPHRFNAKEWVSAIKASGAKYICLTSRHHDGFSMWNTKYSDYDIVDATPYKRDILKELSRECNRQGIKLHLYYSHVDWGRRGASRDRPRESPARTEAYGTSAP